MSEQLQTTKPEAIDSGNALTWPENSPSISADVNLARFGKRVDFDMAAYLRLLDDEKISSEDRGKLKVNMRSLATTRGGYTPSTKTINTSIAHLADPEINKNLLHETKHFIQDTEGDTSYISSSAEMKKRRRIGKIIGAAGSAAIVGTGVGLVPIVGLEAAIMFAAPASAFVALGPGLGRHLGYKTHPKEREARRFAKKRFKKYPSIIKTSDFTPPATSEAHSEFIQLT